MPRPLHCSPTYAWADSDAASDRRRRSPLRTQRFLSALASRWLMAMRSGCRFLALLYLRRWLVCLLFGSSVVYIYCRCATRAVSFCCFSSSGSSLETSGALRFRPTPHPSAAAVHRTPRCTAIAGGSRGAALIAAAVHVCTSVSLMGGGRGGGGVSACCSGRFLPKRAWASTPNSC